MGFQIQNPSPELLLEGHRLTLTASPEVPYNAYPPVLEGERPMLVIDDIALDLSCEEAKGYRGFWVIENGQLYLRWLLGRNQVRWDIQADWVTETLVLQDGPDRHRIHVVHGRIDGQVHLHSHAA